MNKGKKKVNVAKRSYAVLGLGKFGSSVAIELSRMGADVLAVDCNEERVAELADIVTCAVKADVCDTGTMATLGLSNMDGVVVAITGSIHASVLGTILAKEAGVPYVMAKSQDEVHSKILEKVGADKVMIPEKESGIATAHAIMSGTFMDFVELSESVSMIELTPKSEWIGKSLRELDLRKKKRINIIAMRENGEISPNPDPEKKLTDKISLLVLVDRRDIKRLYE